MSDWYELIGQTPVLMDGGIIEKALRFGTADRRVALTNLYGLCSVSTVFLGLDHSWGFGPPMLFETMAFWQEEGGRQQERCSTWAEAEEQHARVCAECARPSALVRYVGRHLTSRWADARRDFSRRWREMRGVEEG
jgi:hypothetical protein